MFQRKKNSATNTKPKAENKDVTATKSSTSTTTNYAAKKSTRILGKLTGDNDTWMEGFAVVNTGNSGNVSNSKKKIGPPIVRTYFQSQTTGQKVWDEPPSGASNTMYASEETRQMAEVQVKRLTEKNAKKNSNKKKVKDEDYKKVSYKNPDYGLQQAIAASLNGTQTQPQSSLQSKKKKKKKKTEDVAYSMAKAVSISEHQAKLKDQEEKEQLMIKQAIKLSLEEDKLSEGSQEIMQGHDQENVCWSSTPCLLSEVNDDFFSSSVFALDQIEENKKMLAFNLESDNINKTNNWNGRFAMPSPMKKDRYLIDELD